MEASPEFCGEGGLASGFHKGRGMVIGLLQGGEQSARLIGGDEDRTATESFDDKEWRAAIGTIPFGGEDHVRSGHLLTRRRASASSDGRYGSLQHCLWRAPIDPLPERGWVDKGIVGFVIFYSNPIHGIDKPMSF